MAKKGTLSTKGPGKGSGSHPTGGLIPVKSTPPHTNPSGIGTPQTLNPTGKSRGGQLPGTGK